MTITESWARIKADRANPINHRLRLIKRETDGALERGLHARYDLFFHKFNNGTVAVVSFTVGEGHRKSVRIRMVYNNGLEGHVDEYSFHTSIQGVAELQYSIGEYVTPYAEKPEVELSELYVELRNLCTMVANDWVVIRTKDIK